MLTIAPIPYIGYALAFTEHRDPYGDLCANEASQNGILLAAKKDDSYAGVLCASLEGNYLRVTYALTMPKYRKKGIFTALMKNIIQNAKQTVKVNIVTDNAALDIVVKVCKKFGFTRGEDLTVYTYRTAEDNLWEEYMQKHGRKTCEMLERFGYRAVSFKDADDDLIQQIRNSRNSDFDNPFDPCVFIDNPAKKLSWEYSFAAVKDGRLAAYTLGTMQDTTRGVLEQIAAAADKRNTGVILLPFTATVEAFRKMGGTMAAYAIYGSNQRANALRDKLVNISSAKSSQNYYLYK